MFNLVEASSADSSNFNQSCKYGNLVDGHAVYCHNDGWKEAPRKCRRTWYTGGVTRDEDCEGFSPNSASDGVIAGQEHGARNDDNEKEAM